MRTFLKTPRRLPQRSMDQVRRYTGKTAPSWFLRRAT
ncbi:hypothetical protein VDGL01_10979 [Verticillium dahliae]